MFDSTRIGALLHGEHETTLKAMNQLEALLAKHPAKRPPDVADPQLRMVLQELVGSMSNEVSRHFDFEEQHLFPILAEHGEDGIGGFLAEEHAAIRPLAESVVAAARAALKGEAFDAQSWRAFHEAGAELAEREIYHIQKEEMALLAAITSLLDEEQDAELANQYQMMG